MTSVECLDALYQNDIHENRTNDNILVEGLMSIYGDAYGEITKYQSWLRNVILMVENINISVSITTVDEKQALIYVNKAFEALTLYSREEIVGKNCKFLQGEFPSIYEKTARQTMAHTIASKHFCKVLLTNYKKDGTKFRNLLMLFPIKNVKQDLCFYMGLQCDISSEITSFNHVMKMEDLMTILPKVINEDVVDDFPTDIVVAVKSWLKVVPQYTVPQQQTKTLPRIGSTGGSIAPPPSPQLHATRTPLSSRYKKSI